MRTLIREISTTHTPESLAQATGEAPGLVLLRSGLFGSAPVRYSFVTAQPFLIFRSYGSRCELLSDGTCHTQFGNPWHLLDSLMSRCELLDQTDLPFPLGGCFGYWGYDLKNFVEPKLPRRAVNDLELPDCHVGFYDSLVVFDHHLGTSWIVSTGLAEDGSRSEARARDRLEFWRERLERDADVSKPGSGTGSVGAQDRDLPAVESGRGLPQSKTLRGLRGLVGRDSVLDCASPLALSETNASACGGNPASVRSNLSRADFLDRVRRAQDYIRAGDIYQVNLAQRLTSAASASAWELFLGLSGVSPAPFAAYLDCGDFQIVSSSPEQFLRLSGSHIQTRPIKGTRPRSSDPARDAQLSYELQTSPKEMAELVMITDLLRNDLGKVCEFGSVQVAELARLERYPQVQHLVSTVEGRLRPDTTHFSAFASCFPGGSITGAPKFRAMEIIDELEPVARGPYTGALGYLGFNRESQLGIIIRTAICAGDAVHFHVGAGIVADSVPAAEYEETLAKARGFLDALARPCAASPGLLAI
jgi:para-aminobenzoate synthetase component I